MPPWAAAVGAFASVHAGALGVWLINRLNFWLFLVVILLIQDQRYYDPPLLRRLARWVAGLAGRHPREPEVIP